MTETRTTKTTLATINHELASLYGRDNLQLARGNGYFFFYGNMTDRWYDRTLYRYCLPTLQTVLYEAERMIEESNQQFHTN